MGSYTFPALPQLFRHSGRENNGMEGGVRLWAGNDQLCQYLGNLSADAQFTDFQVQVVPLEDQQFAPLQVLHVYQMHQPAPLQFI